MNYKLSGQLIFFLCLSMAAAEPFELKIDKEYAPNLLKNPGFEELNNDSKPLFWQFDNCSSSKELEPIILNEGAIGRNSAAVKTAGNLFGYWMQEVKVSEDKTYYAHVNFKVSGPRALLWVKTAEYSDKKSPLHHPKSSTEIYAKAYPEHGEELRKVLQYFIDPFYIQAVSSSEWNLYAMEFTVPPGHNITKYAVRAGAYGGNSGWVMIDDVYIGLSQYKLKLEISGLNLKKFKIMTQAGNTVALKELASSSSVQSFEIELPSRTERYFVEVEDTQGKLYRRDIK